MMEASATTGAGSARLLPLREEIGIYPASSALDGSPVWTLHDPIKHRFYRIGWREFEIISRWEAGDAAAIGAAISRDTTLDIEADEIAQFGRFLFEADLLRATSAEATTNFLRKAERQRESWSRWLLHNYLFIRIPLVKPDRFLTQAAKYTDFLYGTPFVLTIIAIGLCGLYFVTRQWDRFLATFVDFYSLQGATYFGVTLAFLKVIHELGHAFTAKRYGCRVPGMGVALLVMVPVLYTDVNDAWKLAARRQRLAIGVAGVLSELYCAAIALFLWGFLPDGPARSAAFLVATSTWLTTVLINLSPFMRYDGYYVLSDWLEFPNLHHRSFALARWWLREKLLGLDEPPPEEFPAARQRGLIFFAFLTWVYRFSLFIGIAALVYAFVIKILGVAMAAVEVGYFLVWPVIRELKEWWGRRADIRLTPRTIATAASAVVLVLLLIVPWRTSIEAPAVLKSARHVGLFVPEFGARVGSVNIRSGEVVEKGTVLAELSSPDLEFKLYQARATIETLQWQLSARGMDSGLLERSLVASQEYAAAVAEYRALLDQQSRLVVTSPFAGRIVDVFDGVDPGTWMPPKTRLLSLVDAEAQRVEAYVYEGDLDRVISEASAKFIMESDSRIEIPIRLKDVARASTRVLAEPVLASIAGGQLPVRPTKQNTLALDQTVYRAAFEPAEGASLPADRLIRGTVIMAGQPVSLIGRAWRACLAVLVRESGA